MNKATMPVHVFLIEEMYWNDKEHSYYVLLNILHFFFTSILVYSTCVLMLCIHSFIRPWLIIFQKFSFCNDACFCRQIIQVDHSRFWMKSIVVIINWSILRHFWSLTSSAQLHSFQDIRLWSFYISLYTSRYSTHLFNYIHRLTLMGESFTPSNLLILIIRLYLMTALGSRKP